MMVEVQLHGHPYLQASLNAGHQNVISYWIGNREYFKCCIKEKKQGTKTTHCKTDRYQKKFQTLLDQVILCFLH
jgi:hypothetical protein